MPKPNRSRESVEQRKAYMVAYREANPDKVKAWKAAYYQRHKEEHKAKVYAERAKNKEHWLAANREYQRKRVKEDPNYWRKKGIKSLYGITWDKFVAMMTEQEGKCLICQRDLLSNRPCIDHEAGPPILVRGILCNNCNVMVGHARDNPLILREAEWYLDAAWRKQESAS